MMKGEVSRKDFDAVYAIKKHIDANLSKRLPQSALIKVGPTNEFVLRHVFKQVYGHPPGQYIIRKKMELGYYLITHTQKSMEDIAQACGYQTASHFGKIFKEMFGKTPAKLRGLRQCGFFIKKGNYLRLTMYTGVDNTNSCYSLYRC